MRKIGPFVLWQGDVYVEHRLTGNAHASRYVQFQGIKGLYCLIDDYLLQDLPGLRDLVEKHERISCRQETASGR